MTMQKHRLQIVEHNESGWLVATAEDLPGFFVQGASVEQLLERTPKVLARYLKGRNIEAANIHIVEEGRPARNIAHTRVSACYAGPEAQPAA